MSNSLGKEKLMWSDNKDIWKRKKLNYDLNLRHHDRSNIPWKLTNGLGPYGLKKYQEIEEIQKEKEQSSDESSEKSDKKTFSLQKNLIVNKLNPYMEIFAVVAIIILVLLIFCLFLDGEDTNKVSNCFIKFKQLKCSVVRPSDQCKTYLECLQNLENPNEEDGEGFKYYLGIIGGFVGFLLKRYFIRGFT